MNYRRPDNSHVVCPECDALVHPMDLCCGGCVAATVSGLEARVGIARQAFNVIYNVKQTGDWERGKKLLVELQEQYDGIVPIAPLADAVISSNRSDGYWEGYGDGAAHERQAQAILVDREQDDKEEEKS